MLKYPHFSVMNELNSKFIMFIVKLVFHLDKALMKINCIHYDVMQSQLS